MWIDHILVKCLHSANRGAGGVVVKRKAFNFFAHALPVAIEEGEHAHEV